MASKMRQSPLPHLPRRTRCERLCITPVSSPRTQNVEQEQKFSLNSNNMQSTNCRHDVSAFDKYRDGSRTPVVARKLRRSLSPYENAKEDSINLPSGSPQARRLHSKTATTIKQSNDVSFEPTCRWAASDQPTKINRQNQPSLLFNVTQTDNVWRERNDPQSSSTFHGALRSPRPLEKPSIVVNSNQIHQSVNYKQKRITKRDATPCSPVIVSSNRMRDETTKTRGERRLGILHNRERTVIKPFENICQQRLQNDVLNDKDHHVKYDKNIESSVDQKQQEIKKEKDAILFNYPRQRHLYPERHNEKEDHQRNSKKTNLKLPCPFIQDMPANSENSPQLDSRNRNNNSGKKCPLSPAISKPHQVLCRRRNAVCAGNISADFFASRSKLELLFVKHIFGETKVIAPYSQGNN